MKLNKLFASGLTVLILSPGVAQPSSPVRLDADLEAIRGRYDLPALAAAVVRDDGIVAIGVSGYRKYGDSVRVTLDDQFHLGSCTKAMNATFINCGELPVSSVGPTLK
jgi:CubicO group peptidase (beta-lactamase class C family)